MEFEGTPQRETIPSALSKKGGGDLRTALGLSEIRPQDCAEALKRGFGSSLPVDEAAQPKQPARYPLGILNWRAATLRSPLGPNSLRSCAPQTFSLRAFAGRGGRLRAFVHHTRVAQSRVGVHGWRTSHLSGSGQYIEDTGGREEGSPCCAPRHHWQGTRNKRQRANDTLPCGPGGPGFATLHR